MVVVGCVGGIGVDEGWFERFFSELVVVVGCVEEIGWLGERWGK